MKLSEGVEWAIHSATVLAVLPSDAAMPAGRLAEYHGVPAAYMAKHLQALSRAGIVESVPGPRGGYRLARPAASISMLDVVEAIDGRQPAFRCTEIRRKGPVRGPASAYRNPCSIHEVMNRADAAWRAELEATSIVDLVQMLVERVPRDLLMRGAQWIQEVVR
jgi:Rrf2 family protein